MKPADVIRMAAELIRAGGWCQTQEGETPPVHARDALGAAVPLYAETRGDTSKGKINPDAVAFSVYGAVAKVASTTAIEQPGVLWDTLTRLARDEMGGETHAPGGTGFVHPVIGYNEAPDRTKEHVIAFLETAANVLDPPAGHQGVSP